MAQRDNQVYIVPVAGGTITADVSTTVYSTTVIDIQDARAASFLLANDSGDPVDVAFVATESDTSGGTYTAVAADKLLPTKDQDYDENLQVFGVWSTKQFLKIGLVGGSSADSVAVVTALLHKNLSPEDWDTDAQP